MGVLRACLFGKLHVQWQGQIVIDLSARKVQELFCYLLLHRDRPHTRETLATLLWDNSSTAQSKKYLRQTLWQLRAALCSSTWSDNGSILSLESDWVQISPEANLWLDVTVFEQAFALAQGVSGKQLDAQLAQILQDAVQLYQGDLLEGWYQDWCLFERERLQNMYLAMLDRLIDYCEANRDYEAGLAYGTCILRHDRARERTHRRMMRLHYLAHNRTAALRQYERCAAALDEELGVEPGKSTMALCEQIRADRLDVPVFVLAEMCAMPDASGATLYELLDHIEQLQIVLDSTRRRIQQEIQSADLALR